MRFDTIYILKPTLEDTDTEIQKIKNEIEKIGKIVSSEVWGNRKLAYPIHRLENGKETDYERGFYGLFTFEIETKTDIFPQESKAQELTKKLVDFYNSESDIIKRIIVKLDMGNYEMEEFK